MQLITDDQRRTMFENAEKRDDANYDPLPVVKLFTPDGNATWLLTELDPKEPHIAFGLCDLGMGFPELGYVDLRELELARGPLGLPIERDLYFEPERTISEYAELARSEQRIVEHKIER